MFRYCSIFFLYKLRLFTQMGLSGWVLRRKSLMSRLRGLFVIALGNFVFPIILNFAQIFFISTDRSFLHGTYILLTNNFVSIIGVVFATVWTSGRSWNSTSVTTGSTWNQESVNSVFTGSNGLGYASRSSKSTNVQFPPSSSPRMGFGRANASDNNVYETDKNFELKITQSNVVTTSSKDQSQDDALAISESEFTEVEHSGYAV
jgi:hypothetical protein